MEERKKEWIDGCRRFCGIVVRGMRESIASFPATQLSIWIGSVYLAAMFSLEIPDEGMFFLLSLGSGTFFAEALFLAVGKGKVPKPVQAVLYLAAALHGGLFAWVSGMEADGSVLGMETGIFREYAGRYAICYFLVIYLLAFYWMYRASRMRPEGYLVHLFAGVLRTGILYGILTVGVSMVLGICGSLFDVFPYQDLEAVMQIQCLIFGFVFLSSLLRCLTVREGEEKGGAFEEMLVKYVLMGLVCGVFVIVYVYVLKILLLRDMPSNQVFSILTALFVLGVPIWTMDSGYEEKNPLLGIGRRMPYLFLPLIFLQGYCMAIRIHENGFTPSRYAGIMFLLFELLYLGVYHFRRQALGLLLPMGAVLILTASLLPGLNMYALSVRSQRNDLERLLEKPETELTEEERLRAVGAYAYLEEDPAGNRYLASLEGEWKEKTERLAAGEYGTEETKICFSAGLPNNCVEVEGFRRLYPMRESSRAEGDTVIDLTEYAVTVGEDVCVAFDLGSYLDRCLEWRKDMACGSGEEDMDAWLRDNQRIRLDGRYQIQIYRLSFRYDLEREGYVTVGMSGYVLER